MTLKFGFFLIVFIIFTLKAFGTGTSENSQIFSAISILFGLLVFKELENLKGNN